MSLGSGWDGLDDALRAIDKLADVAKREVVEKALMKVAKPIAEDMAANCPKETGLTADDFRAADSPLGKIGLVAVDIGARKGKRGRSFVARWIEFGIAGRGIPAHPFMRPAWDRARVTLAADFTAELRKAYQSIVRRASRG